jgi:hypothetical protein
MAATVVAGGKTWRGARVKGIPYGAQAGANVVVGEGEEVGLGRLVGGFDAVDDSVDAPRPTGITSVVHCECGRAGTGLRYMDVAGGGAEW